MIGGHIVTWRYGKVFDEYLGLYRRFRWREAPCGCIGPGGVDCQFQLYCGLCGKYDGIADFINLDDGIGYCRNDDFRYFYGDFHVF